MEKEIMNLPMQEEKNVDIRKDIDLFISEQLKHYSDTCLAPDETSKRIKALAELVSARALLQ